MTDTSMFTNTDPFGQFLTQYPTQAQQSAAGYIAAYLQQFNLGSLTDFAKNLIINQGITDPNVLQQQLYATPEFKAEYPEIEARQKKGLPPLAPADIINLRTGYQQALVNNGIDPSYFSPEDMHGFATNDVSAVELDNRIKDTVAKVQSDPAIQPQLSRLYGIGATPGEVAAYFLDPTKAEPYLAKQLTSGQLAARGEAAGLGQLTAQQGEGIAGQMQAGTLSQGQVTAGLGTLAQEQPLMNVLPGENQGANISQNEQLAAQFDNNAAAACRIAQRSAQRGAAFGGGGRFGTNTSSGVTGIGATNTP